MSSAGANAKLLPQEEAPRRPTWHNMDGAKLRWYEYMVILGLATFLALVAGQVNIITLMSALGIPSSHMTGIATQIGRGNATGNWAWAATNGGAFLSFVFGAALTGMICNDRNWSVGPRYGYILLLEAALLVTGYIIYSTEYQLATLFINCFACGLQNALGTMYGSAIVRTTHMTGAATDIGLALGHIIMGRKPTAAVGEAWKLRFFIPLVLFYVCGTTSGATLFGKMGYDAVMVPTLLVAGLGLLYTSIFLSLDYKPMEPLKA